MTVLDTEIRRALLEKGLEADVPEDLAARTIAAAHEADESSRWKRFRLWRDTTGQQPIHISRRWIYAVAAIAMVAMLFTTGNFLTTTRGLSDKSVDQDAAYFEGLREDSGAIDAEDADSEQSGASSSGDAIGGDGTGVVSSGDASVDAQNRRDTSAGGSAEATLANTSEDEDVLGVNTAPTRPRSAPLPPKIVRTAKIEVEVKKSTFERAWDKANDIAALHRGFVTNAKTEQIDGKLGRGTVTMRIPSTRLDGSLDDLRELGKLQLLTTNAEDVSSQIVDIDARLRALRAEEAQLIELLDRTNGLAQVLEVRTQLNALRQDIESLDAQKASYNDQVEYSTVNATLFEAGAEPEGPRKTGIILQAWRTALSAGLTIVGGTIVVLGGLLPLAAIAALIWLGVRSIRRRRV